jgi:D-ribose pyranose/furanose isomerase RbsD
MAQNQTQNEEISEDLDLELDFDLFEHGDHDDQSQPSQSHLDVSTSKPQQVGQAGFIELWLVDFNLPSKYIAKISTKSEKIDEKTYKIETLINGYLARKIENIRRVAYSQIGRYFVSTSIGWIAVNEKGIKIIKELNATINSALREIIEKKQITIKDQTYEIPEELVKRIQNIISKYYVKSIKILLEYEDAKYIIENVIQELKEGVEELQEKIEKAKQDKKKTLAKVYEYDASYQEMLLQSFEEFYAKKFQTTQ